MDAQLKQTIADELNVDAEMLTSDKSLDEVETWDSVMILSVMVIIGEAVGAEITPEEMTRLKTFGDIEALVDSKTA